MHGVASGSPVAEHGGGGPVCHGDARERPPGARFVVGEDADGDAEAGGGEGCHAAELAAAEDAENGEGHGHARGERASYREPPGRCRMFPHTRVRAPSLHSAMRLLVLSLTALALGLGGRPAVAQTAACVSDWLVEAVEPPAGESAE